MGRLAPFEITEKPAADARDPYCAGMHEELLGIGLTDYSRHETDRIGPDHASRADLNDSPTSSWDLEELLVTVARGEHRHFERCEPRPDRQFDPDGEHVMGRGVRDEKATRGPLATTAGSSPSVPTSYTAMCSMTLKPL